MSTSQDEDRWLDVLAGRAAPSNDDERKAARARQFFQIEAEHDLQLDSDTRQRVENLLAVKLADRQSQLAQAAKPQPGCWADLLGWFAPGGTMNSGRFATAAMAVLGLVVLPYFLNPSTLDAHDPSSIKSPITVPEAVIAAEQPAQDAAKLLQALVSQGVVATLTEEGPDRVVKARISPDKLSAVAGTLQQDLGVVLPPDGELRVRFKASAP